MQYELSRFFVNSADDDKLPWTTPSLADISDTVSPGDVLNYPLTLAAPPSIVPSLGEFAGDTDEAPPSITVVSKTVDSPSAALTSRIEEQVRELKAWSIASTNNVLMSGSNADAVSDANPSSVAPHVNCGHPPSPSDAIDDVVASNTKSERHRRARAISALRYKLLANGYHPVPVTAPKSGDEQAGKKPLLKNWQNVCAAATQSTILGWESERTWTNTGLLCGVTTAGEEGVVGVDNDVLNEEVSREIEELAIKMLGPSPLRRVGRAPKSLFVYGVNEVFGKFSTNKLVMPSGDEAAVEILAKGGAIRRLRHSSQTEQVKNKRLPLVPLRSSRRPPPARGLAARDSASTVFAT